jgi:hypothetical protein
MATSNKTTAAQMFVHHEWWLPDLSTLQSYCLAVSKVLPTSIFYPVRSLTASHTSSLNIAYGSVYFTYPQKNMISKLIYVSWFSQNNSNPVCAVTSWKKYGVNIRIGIAWFRTGSSSELLFKEVMTFGGFLFRVGNILATWPTVNDSITTLVRSLIAFVQHRS